MDFSFLRREYQSQPLLREQLNENPVQQLLKWLDEATGAGMAEPNAMFLATASTAAKPSGRIVLLKKLDDAGLLFYTNYNSRKAQELIENPQAAVNLFWQRLERQVTVEGSVQKTSPGESAVYFASRPRSSQIAAWASPQGEPIPNRTILKIAFEEADRKFKDQDVPMPPHWGGFRLVPERFEFWQGAPHRLHDRFQYKRHDGDWIIEQLAP